MVSKQSPVFICPLVDLLVGQGQVVVMQCAIKGIPEPEVKWYMNDLELHADGKHRFEENFQHGLCKMIVYNVCLSDTGQYKVVVSNALGQAESSAVLDVKCKLNSR